MGNNICVVDFLTPPLSTKAYKKHVKYKRSYGNGISFVDGRLCPVGMLQETKIKDVEYNYDKHECFNITLKFKELFEQSANDEAMQEIIRHLTSKDDLKDLLDLKKYLYHKCNEQKKPHYFSSISIGFLFSILLTLFFPFTMAIPIFPIAILTSVAVFVAPILLSVFTEHRKTNTKNVSAKKENQLKEYVLGKIKETQIKIQSRSTTQEQRPQNEPDLNIVPNIEQSNQNLDNPYENL